MPAHTVGRDSPPSRPSNWNNSDRRSRLPSDWPKIRKQVFKRDSPNGRDWRLAQCQWRMQGGGICGAQATEVDHINRGDDHSLINLQALCTSHHRRKSSSEGGVALRAKRRRISKKFVRTESHPGLI